MKYTTKLATDLTRGDRPIIDGTAYTVLDQRGIISKHSAGRVGYTLRGDDGRCYRLSMVDTDRIEVE